MLLLLLLLLLLSLAPILTQLDISGIQCMLWSLFCHLPPSGEVRANGTSRLWTRSVGNCAIAVAVAVAAAAAAAGRYFPRFAGREELQRCAYFQ